MGPATGHLLFIRAVAVRNKKGKPMASQGKMCYLHFRRNRDTTGKNSRDDCFFPSP